MPGTATIRRLRGGFEKCCNVDRKLTWRRETDDTLLVVGLGQQGYEDAGLQEVAATFVVGVCSEIECRHPIGCWILLCRCSSMRSSQQCRGNACEELRADAAAAEHR